MNIIDQLISEQISKNGYHAANMLNVLECGRLARLVEVEAA